MTSRQPANQRGSRALGIGILILSVVHVPLPQADYHNIRHHDLPGEICGYHDHLLRWHPSADLDDDVTMLHWHWFVPIVEFGDHHQRADDDQHRPAQAHPCTRNLGDWPAPEWRGEPVVRPDSRGRLLDHLVLGLSDASLAHLADLLILLGPQKGRFSLLIAAGRWIARIANSTSATLELLTLLVPLPPARHPRGESIRRDHYFGGRRRRTSVVFEMQVSAASACRQLTSAYR